MLVLEPNPGPTQEQQVLFNTEPSLQPETSTWNMLYHISI